MIICQSLTFRLSNNSSVTLLTTHLQSTNHEDNTVLNQCLKPLYRETGLAKIDIFIALNLYYGMSLLFKPCTVKQK